MIDVNYKCRCMKDKVALKVLPRGDEQDILEWLRCVVGPTIAEDHDARSPLCGSERMEFVEIPIVENAAGIGCAPKLDS